MLSPVPDQPILPVVPCGPQKSKARRHELYPKEPPEKDSSYHPAKSRYELVLNGLLLEHLAVVSEDRGIERDRNRIREQECGRNAAQQRPPFARNYPYRQNRPQQREDMGLGHRYQQCCSRQERAVLP